MSRRIVGITGLARHGKDTVGSLLVSEQGFTKVGFADSLRSLALSIDPFISGGNIRLSSAVRAVGWDQAKKVPEVRRLLQVIGTEGVRNHLGDDAWIRAAKRKIELVEGPAVITDVRFPNEADAVREWGGEIWRVVRVNKDRTPYDNGVGTAHASEKHISSLPRDWQVHASSVYELEMSVRRKLGLTSRVSRLLFLAEAD